MRLDIDREKVFGLGLVISWGEPMGLKIHGVFICWTFSVNFRFEDRRLKEMAIDEECDRISR